MLRRKLRSDRFTRTPEAWTRKAIINVGRSGKFSSDRTIAEYAQRFGRLKPYR